MLTERDLIHSAKVFRNNCGANGDNISFIDACKVVILSKILERGRDELTNAEMELVLKLIRDKKAWYKFWS